MYPQINIRIVLGRPFALLIMIFIYHDNENIENNENIDICVKEQPTEPSGEQGQDR